MLAYRPPPHTLPVTHTHLHPPPHTHTYAHTHTYTSTHIPLHTLTHTHIRPHTTTPIVESGDDSSEEYERERAESLKARQSQLEAEKQDILQNKELIEEVSAVNIV